MSYLSNGDTAEYSKIRSSLFELLNHIKRWFIHLLQQYDRLLEIKHLKLSLCIKDDKVSRDFAIFVIKCTFSWTQFSVNCQRFKWSSTNWWINSCLISKWLSSIVNVLDILKWCTISTRNWVSWFSEKCREIYEFIALFIEWFFIICPY